MIKIYGSPVSSAGRCYWCLEEVGVTYERIPLDFKAKEHKAEAYLKINPNGKVPALVDGAFQLWESLAINNYLAEKHKPQLLGTSVEERALVGQWSVWGLVEMQPPLIQIFIQKFFIPEDRKDEGVVSAAQEKVKPFLRVLDYHLASRSHLVGQHFTLADLNVGSVVAICDSVDIDLTGYSNVVKWKSSFGDRPAYQKYQELVAKS